MQYKVLVVTDLHKRDTDFKTIGGFVNAVEAVNEDLINYVIENQVTHVISAGDWYDKGYRAIHASYSHQNLDRRMNTAVNGNFYMCLGNHFFLERDSNPEMYLIQPNDKYPPKHKIITEGTEPIIKVVNDIKVGCVQFSLFHFDKEDKEYINRRYPDVKFHVGIYHDDIIVPPSVRQKLNIRYVTTSDYLRRIFDNIDMAVVGHVHSAIGIENIIVNNKTIPMVIPGGLAITSSAASEMHTHVKLPLYTVTDDDYKVEFVEFKIHAEKLKFYEKQQEKIPQGLVAPPDLTHPRDVMKSNLGAYLSVEDYLRNKGCDECAIELVRRAAKGELDFKSAIKLAHGRLD